jgi:adenylate cyclase
VTSPSRRLAAILAADVAGYSRLMGADEEGTLARLKAHRRELIDPRIAEHRGRIVKTTGDGMLVEFASVIDAVKCAIEVQRSMELREPGLADDRRIRFRIGVNLGDVIVDGDDIHGDGVNVAARLEALAEPGTICLSAAAWEQVRGKVQAAADDLGEQRLKNIELSIRVFRLAVHAGGAATAQPTLALPDKPSIAVLPFQNMSGDAEQEYFCDGLVEEVITALSRFHWLFVIARNSSFTYKGKSVDVKRVSRELGVRYVLEGSVRKSGQKVRITGQLIDGTTGAHIWADRFYGTLEDIFDLQDQVTMSVVGAIEPKMRQAEIDRARRKPTESLDAYDCYLGGLSRVQERGRLATDEALADFNRAMQLDANYAAAHGMAAWCLMMRFVYGWASNPQRDAQEVERLVKRVEKIGRDDPIALYTAGWALAFVLHDVESGAALIERALELNPNDAVAWGISAYVQTYLGKPEVAIDRASRALRLSPRDPLNFSSNNAMALAYLCMGRYADSAACVQRSLHNYPASIAAFRVGAASNALIGEMETARKLAAQALAMDPDLTLDKVRHLIPLRRPVDMDRFLDGLRMAGIPQ